MKWLQLLKQYLGHTAEPALPKNPMFNQCTQPMSAEEVATLKKKIQRSKEQTEQDRRVSQKTMQIYINI